MLCNADELTKYDGSCELIEGVLYEMSPPGEEHGFISLNIGYLIRHFLRENKIGIATGAETGYKLFSNPDTVRAPDVAFKSNKRLTQEGITKGYSAIMPELVVEVNSPSDSYSKIQQKVNLWMKAGVLQVWVVEPEDKTVVIHYHGGDMKILDTGDELSGGEILPGFKCKVSEIFEM